MSELYSDNPFEYIGSGKRYLTYNGYLQKRFGCKVMKISLNAGFTCPNIDGTKGSGGCTYCTGGSGKFAGSPEKDITEQFFSAKAAMNKKWHEGLYIPYFQAYTNTYAPTEKIRRMTQKVLLLPDVCGIAISTRPDCISEETADYLADLAEKTYLTVELGLQTIFDKTAEIINRCHTYRDFLNGYEKLHKRGINVCVHIINGLPFETHDMMLCTVREISKLDIHAIKIHLLHILKGTKMARDYEDKIIGEMALEDYVQTVCDQLEIIPQNVVIERVTGDGAADELIAPLWSRKKFVVMNEIDKELRRRNSWQGKYSEK